MDKENILNLNNGEKNICWISSEFNDLIASKKRDVLNNILRWATVEWSKLKE